MKYQRLTSESDAPSAASHSGPIRPDESDIAARLKEVMGDEPLLSFARRCGVGETTLRKYLEGAEPSTRRLVAIADTANVNIAWLAAGRGLKKGSAAPSQVQHLSVQESVATYGKQPLDVARLTRAVAAVQEGLQAIGRTLPPEKYAELVAAAYELLDSSTTSASNVIRFIKAAA